MFEPEKRRKALLEHQKATRAAMLQRTRALIDAATVETVAEDVTASSAEAETAPALSLPPSTVAAQMSDDATEPAATTVAWSLRTTKRHAPHMRSVHRFAQQIQLPEWLTSVPADLNGPDDESGWFVLPRPEGRHCLVIAAGGVTAARDAHGFLMAQFHSDLPGGASSMPPTERRQVRAGCGIACQFSTCSYISCPATRPGHRAGLCVVRRGQLLLRPRHLGVERPPVC
jgi:hypothetical protein